MRMCHSHSTGLVPQPPRCPLGFPHLFLPCLSLFAAPLTATLLVSFVPFFRTLYTLRAAVTNT